jgi:hypothetical protein
MKPEMTDDVDLERLVRGSTARPRPVAPSSLRDFIRQVPSVYAVDRSRRRRRIATVAAGLAAVFILFCAGSAALLSIRQSPAVSQSPGTTSAPTPPTSAFDFVSGDWGWRRVAEPAPGVAVPVANGFLGECLANGAPAACTSRDGVAWTLPPDPGVLAVEGGAFAGWSVAHGSSGWVAAGTVDPGTWRSTDGIHWSAVATDLPGLLHAQVQALPAGFAMLAATTISGQPASKLLISTDGAAWTAVDLPAGVAEVRLAGSVGLVGSRVESGSSVAGAVSSADGRNWTALTLPDQVNGLSTTIRLASGIYVGVGTVGTMVTSADGVTWQASTGPGSPVESLVAVGGRLLAIARVPSTDVSALWESADGTAWQRVALLDGKPLSGTQLVSLGDRVGILTGSKLTMIGRPGAGGTAAVSPTATATPETPAPQSTAPAVMVGGWRWH